jgi:hypothetical protein
MTVICIIAEYFVAVRGCLLMSLAELTSSALQTKPSVTFHKNVRHIWRCMGVNVFNSGVQESYVSKVISSPVDLSGT